MKTLNILVAAGIAALLLRALTDKLIFNMPKEVLS